MQIEINELGESIEQIELESPEQMSNEFRSPTPNTTPIQNVVNKKRSKLTMAKLYDNMISATYTLSDGQLNQEKIIQQSYSFTKKS